MELGEQNGESPNSDIGDKYSTATTMQQFVIHLTENDEFLEITVTTYSVQHVFTSFFKNLGKT